MRIVFMGTPKSAVASLRRLIDDGHEVAAVWTQPDKPSGRHHELHASPIKQFALAHGLSVQQPLKIKNDEARALFVSRHADIAVVVAYGKILPAEFLSAPGHGCINVHFSLLPKYRGAAPVNWAIANGETETGVTTMRIVEELDAGPILLQRATSIEPQETAPELLARLSEIGAELLSQTLARLETIDPEPQSDEAAIFAPILKREDGLIDWSTDAFAIERRVRGFQPWPGAYTTLNSRRIIIWQATAYSSEEASNSPGQIAEANAESFRVDCAGKTSLRLLELQSESGRRMSARDFLNGTHVKVGTTFG